ncbi:helix-turn-helix transcriptional regulator [Streptosporangium oxazolinicum]|uniref:Helix-turn-helix transcriptional regulator n=1 Tax=Streptosporangium oxazolinicum TaxID=909287 RepID=A0ABP8B5I6_9ACTN
MAEFLRARREALTPQDAGLPEYGRRRVKGLRREEVAMLAGMSGDYYVRLEQGRESNPSPRVVEAVARALGLDEEATEHLRRLVRPASRRRDDAEDRVSPQLLRLMDGWPASPAFVLGPALDILAANALATALHEGFASGNLARMVFTDPAGRTFYRDWERAARSCVAELRAAHGHDPESARVNRLVDELSSASPVFAGLWARHEVRSKTQGVKHLRHPRVGDLAVQFSSFTVNGAPHQQFVVYQAEPASATAAAFEWLRPPAARETERPPRARQAT